MRTKAIHPIGDPDLVKQQLLQWAQQFQEVIWLDSNDFPAKYTSYDAVLAVEAFTAIRTDHLGAFEKLQEYQSSSNDWIFGYLSYDLKNDLEELTSDNHDGLGFPDLYFFQPKKLLLLKGNLLEIQYLRLVDDEIEEDLKNIKNQQIINPTSMAHSENRISPKIPKDVYLEKVKEVLGHIQRGDIYEANFCQEFFIENMNLDPLGTYNRLNAISNPPFAAFLKLDRKFLFSASPERYIRKEGRKIISQPIKGTAPRSAKKEEDEIMAENLRNDHKERAENIMIVDLVRNDLSKTAARGSVEVEELCGIYSFKQVHQMISTVISRLPEEIPPVEVLRTTFPMGSMTGAPKISAMKIIEEIEETRRGLYSGTLGYFTPEGDFDFNVVIRSILYDQQTRYASFSVGGAITAKSNPEKEYEECLLKAMAMRKVIEGQI